MSPMTRLDPDALLEKIPKRTPVWAVGVISIIVSLSVSFCAVYVLAKGEFQQYLTANFAEVHRKGEISAKEFELESITTSKAFDTVLGLIKVNSEQITSLTIANTKLSERVSALEKELETTHLELKTCEESLRNCKR